MRICTNIRTYAIAYVCAYKQTVLYCIISEAIKTILQISSHKIVKNALLQNNTKEETKFLADYGGSSFSRIIEAPALLISP